MEYMDNMLRHGGVGGPTANGLLDQDPSDTSNEAAQRDLAARLAAAAPLATEPNGPVMRRSCCRKKEAKPQAAEARWRFRLASGCELYMYMLRARLGGAVDVWSWHACVVRARR